MKKLVLFLIGLLIAGESFSQQSNKSFKVITQDQYLLHFPTSTQVSQYYPTTDYVCILPTNETNKELEAEVNEFYKTSFIGLIPTIPKQISRVITDKQALREDLSKVNIYAFGTVNGNLWISKFMEIAKGFPIKITDDSIVAEKAYRANNCIVTALWYNPYNPKHSVLLYIPQHLEFAKNFKKGGLPQYSIWQDGKQIPSSHYYILKDNKWIFSYRGDSLLMLRDDIQNKSNELDLIDKFIYHYPTPEKLISCKIEPSDVPFDTIRISDVNNDFSKLSDMSWIKPIARKYKVIALGESHHLKYNNYILKRLLFSINTYDYYPTLILELPYSYTGYFNYFLSLENDKIANTFRDSVLTKIFKPGIPTIESIRNWNKQHRNKIIQIGFSDLEHNLPVTINEILSPYLRKLGSVSIPNTDKNGDYIDFYQKKAQSLIDQAKKLNLIGEFPFQTPEYMERVLENLIASIKIKLDPKNNNDFTARYQVMIHNVTDERFLGRNVSEGKTIFLGGFEHFRTLNDGSDKKATTTEGYYLAHSFEPTKGKVFSVFINTKSFSIEDSVQIIDPRLGFRIETDLINLYKRKNIKLGEPVISGPFLFEFDKYLYGLSYKYPNYAIRIQRINLDNILKKYEGSVRYVLATEVKKTQDYNTTIIIPSSPIGN